MNILPEHSRYLLFIDDNEAIHDDFRKIFDSDLDPDLDGLDAEFFGEEVHRIKRPKYELCFANQGKAGVDLLQKASAENTRFGAAFVDMRMPPGWDGVETIKHLWEVDPDLQVVICTAFSDQSWDEIAEKLGLSDQLLILKKPFDEVEVVQLAASLSRKRDLLAESRQRLQQLEKVVDDQGNEIQAAQADAELLISSMPCALMSLDDGGAVTRWNPVAEKLFGITASSALGKPFSELPIRWQEPQAVQSALRASPDDPACHELQFLDAQDIAHTLETRICPILGSTGSQARLLLSSDVTLQKALRTQLDQAQRLESVGQLAAGVAHEINTPMQYIGDNVRYVAKTVDQMTSLLDCLPMLVDPGVTDEQLVELRKSLPDIKTSKVKNSLKQIPDALNDSIDGVETVSKIVAAMKEFSHPGTDEKSQICVNHVLSSTITVAKNEWKYVADVETDLQDDLPKIEALSGELNQAFLNMIVNASHAIADRVKAGDFDKGMISISTALCGECVEIKIKDNGGGIPAKARERVFEPFFTTKDVGRGTGQGLAIAHSVIVQKHQGRLWFDVQEGAGTTFYIQLPIRSAAAEPVDAVESAVTN